MLKYFAQPSGEYLVMPGEHLSVVIDPPNFGQEARKFPMLEPQRTHENLCFTVLRKNHSEDLRYHPLHGDHSSEIGKWELKRQRLAFTINLVEILDPNLPSLLTRMACIGKKRLTVGHQLPSLRLRLVLQGCTMTCLYKRRDLSRRHLRWHVAHGNTPDAVASTPVFEGNRSKLARVQAEHRYGAVAHYR